MMEKEETDFVLKSGLVKSAVRENVRGAPVPLQEEESSTRASLESGRSTRPTFQPSVAKTFERWEPTWLLAPITKRFFSSGMMVSSCGAMGSGCDFLRPLELSFDLCLLEDFLDDDEDDDDDDDESGEDPEGFGGFSGLLDICLVCSAALCHSPLLCCLRCLRPCSFVRDSALSLLQDTRKKEKRKKGIKSFFFFFGQFSCLLLESRVREC